MVEEYVWCRVAGSSYIATLFSLQLPNRCGRNVHLATELATGRREGMEEAKRLMSQRLDNFS